jgi:hypothetical protein
MDVQMRSAKTLSRQRPLPSILILIPSSSVARRRLRSRTSELTDLVGAEDLRHVIRAEGIFQRLIAEESPHGHRQVPGQNPAIEPVHHRSQIDSCPNLPTGHNRSSLATRLPRRRVLFLTWEQFDSFMEGRCGSFTRRVIDVPLILEGLPKSTQEDCSLAGSEL